MRFLKAAGAAVNQTPMAWRSNRLNLLHAIRQARESGVSLLCLPELCTSGYGCEDAFASPDVRDRCWRMVSELLPEARGLAVCFGLPVMHRNALFNCAAMAVDGRVVGHSHVQDLVSTEPQDVPQPRLDLLQRPGHARRQDRVVPALPAQRSIAQLRGEGSVAAAQCLLVQNGGHHEVGVGIVLADRAQQFECGRPGRIGHRSTVPGARRAPRTQSAAGMGLLPAGWTRPRRTGAEAVPTSTSSRDASICPGASCGPSATIRTG